MQKPPDLSSLYGAWAGKDVYVLGTGPTSRLFPPDFFDGRKTIGLNRAFKLFRTQVSVTIHPDDSYIEDVSSADPRGGTWVVKPKGIVTLKSLTGNMRVRPTIVFSTSTELNSIGTKDPHKLFVGRGIHQTGVDLAVRMGARAVFLVGVDMGELNGDHHGQEHHVRFTGLPPAVVYQEYRDWMAVVRQYVFKTYKVPVVCLTPLLGVDQEGEYRRMLGEAQLKPFDPPQDTSKYSRVRTDPPPSLESR